ncbi:MAG TPA: divergent polysaccharide deacetylase family protein, partial [Alphaproteobacteria bacterium]|nr:divergent polysaccharide deacetylase family protein [Alphaproteobacteria bacterium]
PTLERDVFIDNELVPDKIRLQLQRAEDIARARGSAILIGHPHKETLDVLRNWIDTLEARGFLLVPLTAVLTEKG